MEHTENCKFTLASQPVELIKTSEGQFFQGYASVWFDRSNPGTEYIPSPGVHYRISPQAFDEVLRSGANVEAWYNHSPEHVLASTASNTLFLSQDHKGLRYTILFDETDPDHLKVASKLRKGIVTGSSWQGLASIKLSKEGPYVVKEIDKVLSLKEVSIVNHPAFKAAGAGMNFCAQDHR